MQMNFNGLTQYRGSVLDPPPYLNLSFHPYTPPSAERPTLHEPEIRLLPPTTIGSQNIFTYASPEGNMSFHRFIIEIPLQKIQTAVRYRLNGGAEMDFIVPALGQNMRWAAHSCNGELIPLQPFLSSDSHFFNIRFLIRCQS